MTKKSHLKGFYPQRRTSIFTFEQMRRILMQMLHNGEREVTSIIRYNRLLETSTIQLFVAVFMRLLTTGITMLDGSTYYLILPSLIIDSFSRERFLGLQVHAFYMIHSNTYTLSIILCNLMLNLLFFIVILKVVDQSHHVNNV
jgi:hypothetical protein